MKDTPQAIRREIVNVGEKSSKGISTPRPPEKVESTCRSCPASFDETVGRGGGHLVAGRGQVRKSADRLAEHLGAMA
jgi:hypothetical protein